MREIAFCYPSRVAGGAEFLFVKCANYLAQTGQYRISYIDYDDGFGYNLLKANTLIEHVPYEKGQRVSLREDTIVITPLNYISSLEFFFSSPQSLKYLIWSINPYNLVSAINLHRHKFFTIGKKKRTEIGKKLKELSERGIIRYMDYNNYYWNSTVFNFSINQKYFLPISVDDFSIPTITSRSFDDNSISFLWLGRLDIDKYNTVLTLLNELDILADKYKVTLYIVGSGKKEKELRDCSRQNNAKIIFTGPLFGAELNDLIANKIDIGFAMGTSALDIAKLGKPVIVEGVLDYPYNAGEQKDYVLLSEIENYDVVSPGYYRNDFNRDFKSLVDYIIINYDECAIACAEYVNKNHSMTSVGRQLEQALETVGAMPSNVVYDIIRDVSRDINSRKVDNNLIFRVTRRLLNF